MSSDKLNRAYIDSKLDAILHAMTTKVFLANPPDHIEFMMKYLQEHHGKRPGVNANERIELEVLRKEVQQLKNTIQGNANVEDDGTTDSDKNSNISSEEDEVAELEIKPVVNKNMGPRASVSAEAFGSWNKKEEFKAPFFPKTDEQKEALKLRLD